MSIKSWFDKLKAQNNEEELPEEFNQNEDEEIVDKEGNELIISTPQFFFESTNSVGALFKKKNKDKQEFFGLNVSSTTFFNLFAKTDNQSLIYLNECTSNVLYYRVIADSDELSDVIDEITSELIPTKSSNLKLEISNKQPYDTEATKMTNKEKVIESFNKVINAILPINSPAFFEIVRQMYVDGGGYFIINRDKEKGLKEVAYADLLSIVKVVEGNKYKFVYIVKPKSSYVMTDFVGTADNQNFEIPNNRVIFIPTGKLDMNGFPVSEMKKVVRPFNNFRMIENSALISIFASAPEKFIFKIGTNGLSKPKKEELLKRLAEEYAVNLSMDAETGMVNYKSKNLSIREHYWFTESAGQSHSVETLSANNKIADPEFLDKFYNKLIKSTHLPLSRKQEDSKYNFGRVEEIDNQEKNFFMWKKRKRKFIESLIFSLMKIDLQAQNVYSYDEFDTAVLPKLHINWTNDDIFERMQHDAYWQSVTDLYNSSRVLLDDNMVNDKFYKEEIMQLPKEATKGTDTEETKETKEVSDDEDFNDRRR